jgi:integrase
MKRTARRDKGTGSIYQRKDGRWEGRLRRDGYETICVYGKSKQDVSNKLFAAPRQGTPQDAEALTVGEWLDCWLKMARAGTASNRKPCRFSTYSSYKNTVEKHIKPYLKDIKLRRLAKPHIYSMLDKLKQTARARTVKEAYKVLHIALQVALRRDKVTTNAAALVDAPIHTYTKRVFIENKDQIARFIKATAASEFRTFYLTLLDTGLRQGELLALTWDCLDLDTGTIFVRAGLVRDEDGKLVAIDPKTESSKRPVKLRNFTVRLLRTHRKKQMASKQASPWVFPGPDGGPRCRDGALRKDFRRVVKTANIPGLTFYGLRHTHATMLDLAGAPESATQHRLGHSNSRTTRDFYIHRTQAMDERAVTALDSLYASMGQK